jgi:2-phospho-L-lactate guanylyltransferase
MHAALVPVRGIANAKKRLASRSSVAEREALALAMLADMLGALTRARSVDRMVVVSADSDLLAHARRHGAEVIDEGEPRGLNAAVELASRALERDGVTRLLTIPGDVPLLDPGEIDRLFATDPLRHPVVLVPSGDQTGTNGLLTSPPTVIESCFEGASLAAHAKACRRAGIEPLVLRLAGFALDVDTPSDLSALARQDRDRLSVTLAARGRDAEPEHSAAPPPAR